MEAACQPKRPQWQESVLERVGVQFPLVSCCRHPGRTAILGYEPVLASWLAVLHHIAPCAEFPIHPRHVRRFISPCGCHGEIALLEEVFSQMIPVTNHFAMVNGAWRMIIHEALER